jgi:hypothetical protein
VGGIRTSNLRNVSYSQYACGSTSPGTGARRCPQCPRAPSLFGPRLEQAVKCHFCTQPKHRHKILGTAHFASCEMQFILLIFVPTLANNWQYGTNDMFRHSVIECDDVLRKVRHLHIYSLRHLHTAEDVCTQFEINEYNLRHLHNV